MRHLLPTLLLAAAIGAQSPLGLPFNSNNGLGAQSSVLFDLTVTTPAGVTITALDVNTSATIGTQGSIELWTTPTTYVGSQQIPANWLLAGSGPVVSKGQNQPSPVCLGAGVYLPAGSYGVAVRYLGVASRYTDSTGTVTVSTGELTFAGGQSQTSTTPFAGAPINNRVFNGNVYYNVGNVPGGACASVATYGTGCYAGAYSFYESFASLSAFDFVGAPGTEQVLAAQPFPAGYVVTAGSPAWYAPTSAKVLTNATSPAAMADDSMSQPLNLPFAFAFPGGSTSVIHAAANGYVLLGATTATTSDYSPTAAEIVAQQPRLCPMWCDLQPATNVTVNAASGVYFDVDPSGLTAYVTWLDVADRRGAVPAAGATHVNVQVALHSDGRFEYRYGAIAPGTGTGIVFAAWSQGNALGSAARDPGSRDLSASLPLVTDGPDSTPLAHTVSLPRIGSNCTFGVSGVENFGPVAILFFGDTAVNPGVDLGMIGAPGCNAYTNASLGSATLPVTLPAGTGSYVLAIPADPALGGQSLTSQMVAFTTKNALGLATSNGALWTLGN